ncbi:response regulator transcription factor [Brevibacillus fulvus]|uniref:YesN/AraC family two-component response regulator n=1 Tax=Brevibacillus fulvus TaxID=1125967 RepID=A0A938XYG8_9BACL|nr:response regulator [Brevibacillus fulvus]MBM7589229.1 YesN/AraC family two-component response regulator [Brevibacillus fulvus]
MNSILLVDDERWVRTALRWSIHNLDLPFQVKHESENGLEALDWLKQNEVDLILTDIRMPVMDGLAFTEQLRQLQFPQDVIVISVHDEFPFVQHALRIGVSDYLLKPVEESDLQNCLNKWLQKQEKDDERSSAPQEAMPPSTIELVLQYIRETPLCEVTLTEAAKRVHMNPSYLSQFFKQQLNKNFVEYVTELRIEEAKKLLASTSLRISEIADRLGYSDLAYFSNNFKRITGNTPSEYRKIRFKTS